MNYTGHIISQLPYSEPFLFADAIHHIDEDSVEGSFYLNPDLDFYKGHFKTQPVTPGVILTEIMAQIGVACLGIRLTESEAEQGFPFALSSTEVEFLKPVFPGETVVVRSRKVYYRFGKLKCNVAMFNANGETVCEGTIAGILMKNPS